MTSPLPSDIVRELNLLGPTATLGQAAAPLHVTPAFLYARYPSIEALGEAWLTTIIPTVPATPSLHAAFSTHVLDMVGALEQNRDFARHWFATMKASGPLHLPQLLELHDAETAYFLAWLDANQASLSLPPNVRYDDVRTEIADSLAAAAFWLFLHWETDRSVMCARTLRMIDATAYLLDALLVRRQDFGAAGLLVHLHVLLDQQHQQFLRPLLDLFVKPDRAARYGDPVSLLEALRTLRPMPAVRA